MLLIISVGNTSIKFAICKNKEILYSWVISSRIKYTVDEYYAIINTLISKNHVDLTDIKAVMISSVVPNLNFTLSLLCTKYLKLNPIILEEPIAFDIGISIEFTNKIVGLDRIAAVAIAHNFWPNENLLIIDMGTVTTFNTVTKQGKYYGQTITIGMETLFNSLRNSTAQLPQVKFNKPLKILGNSTSSAMESGLFWSYKLIIEGIINQIISEEQKEFKIIATGGNSNHFIDIIPLIHHFDPDLTIRGLIFIYNSFLKLDL